jgi:lipopolysaccharide transport system ATP-binding protein
MQDVSRDGRTVLFVSHNMLAVQRLCSRALFLENGRLKASGAVPDIVADYLSVGSSDGYAGARSQEFPRITRARVLTAAPRTDAVVEVEVEWHLPLRVRGIKVGVGVNTLEGQRIFDSSPEDLGSSVPEEEGSYRATFRVPPHTFLARSYLVSVGLWSTPSGGRSIVYDHQSAALRLVVEAAPAGPYAHQRTRDGLVHIDECDWKIHEIECLNVEAGRL